MTLTNEERNYLKEKCIELFDEYDYPWSDDGVDRMLEVWEENNEPLIEAFRNHPNYIEGKFMIAFDTNYDRKIDTHGSYEFTRWLIRAERLTEIQQYLPEEMVKKRDEDHCAYLPDRVFQFLNNLTSYASRTISEETANYLNIHVPEIHAHTGQKTTRVINKLCTYLGFDKVDGYNREFAKYADSLNPLKIKRHTVLSLNPIDYLTMSFGNSWSSCHTIDKDNKRDMPNGYQGMYSSGTISYMLDGTSMVFYTVDASYNGTDYFTQPKITRQMFHFGEDKLVQGRLYPADGSVANDIYTQYRNLVQEIIAKIFDVPNLWTVKRSEFYNYIASYGTHYRDYNHFGECTLSLLKGSEKIFNKMKIGRDPICISCGDSHSTENSIVCRSCNGEATCCECGEYLDEDDVIWIDGDPYCRDCVSWCDYCEEYHIRESYYVRNYGYVCEDCISEFTYCEECDEYVHNGDIVYVNDDVNHPVCTYCYDRNYRECEECGEVHYKDDMILYNGEWYCEDCIDTVKANDEEESEAV